MGLKKITFTWPESVPENQIDKKFIQGMLDRMAFGLHNYGHARRKDHRPDNLACLDLRIKEYLKTHNTEFLMDGSNFLMMEFMVPQFKDAFFKKTSKEESPGAIYKDKQHVKGKEETQSEKLKTRFYRRDGD